jgi:hypothetical protein
MRDAENGNNTVIQLREYLGKGMVHGKLRAWCFHHSVIPLLSWPLLIYDIPMARVKVMERLASWFLRKWLGFPLCFSAIGLYGKTNNFIMPILSIVEECKIAKDLKVSGTKAVLSISGSKCNTEDVWNEAVSRLQNQDIVGRATSGMRGLEVTKRKDGLKQNQRTRRELIQLEARR